MNTIAHYLGALERALDVSQLGLPAVIGAVAAGLLLVMIGVAILIAAIQGRTNVTIDINLGRSRRLPP